MATKKENGLKQNYIYNFVSQILVLFIPLITTPYLARILGVDTNGQISFASSIVSYFALLANFGFSAYGQREIAKYQDNPKKQAESFWEILILRAAFTIISLSVLLILVFSNSFEEKYKTFILIESVLVLACAIDPTFYYQGIEDFRSIAIRTALVKTASLVLIFTFVKQVGDAWIYLLINCSASFASYLFMWPKIIKSCQKIDIHSLHFKNHLRPAFLIFLPSLAVTIYSIFDKTMIGLLSTNPDYENGCYEQAYKINSIILLLVTVISPIMLPRNAHDFSEGNFDSLRKHLCFSINYVWLIGLPLIVGTCVLAPSLSYWYLGDGYDEVPLLLQIMSVRYVASGFSETFGNQYFIATGKEKYSTMATIVGAVVNLISNFFFIKLWGGTGAAITTVISEVLVSIIMGIVFFKKKVLPLSEFLTPAIKCLIASAIMFLPVYFLNQVFNYSVWSFLLIVVVGFVTYALALVLLHDSFFINILKSLFKQIKIKVGHVFNKK